MKLKSVGSFLKTSTRWQIETMQYAIEMLLIMLIIGAEERKSL